MYFCKKIDLMRFHTRKWVKPEDLNPNGIRYLEVNYWLGLMKN